MDDKKIYVRQSGEWIVVSGEDYYIYHKYTGAHRSRMRDHKRCVCPRRRWWYCDASCATCEYAANVAVSLDQTAGNDSTTTVIDMVGAISDDPADQVMYSIAWHRLTELLPDAVVIGRMRVDGCSWQCIADALGVPRTTLTQRIKTLRRKLQQEYPDIFDD